MLVLASSWTMGLGMASEAYEGLGGREAEPILVHAGDEDSLATDVLGKGTGDLECLSIVIKLGVGSGDHVVKIVELCWSSYWGY